MKTKIPIGISIDKDILYQIDKDRGEVPRSRYLLNILKSSVSATITNKKIIESDGKKDFFDSNLSKRASIKSI